jgi:hypothetical protein
MAAEFHFWVLSSWFEISSSSLETDKRKWPSMTSDSYFVTAVYFKE